MQGKKNNQGENKENKSMSMNLNTDLTQEELNMLSEAYLECKLSKIQEKELELVLASTDITSPIIEEAREIMGIMTAVDALRLQKRNGQSVRKRWFLWSIAACVACIVIVSAAKTDLWGILDSNAVGNQDLIVYVDGRRITGEVAEKRAQEIEMRCMAMYERTMQNSQKRQAEANKIINQKLDMR